LRENPRETVFLRGILPLGTSADMPFPYPCVKVISLGGEFCGEQTICSSYHE